jgi:23S rRNA (adenine2503-C2)-methyltransferase
LFPEELAEFLAEYKQKPYRAAQIFKGFHQRCAAGWDQITDLPLDLRKNLDETVPIRPLGIDERRESRDGTEKFTLKLKDGLRVEAVLMDHRGDYARDRKTLCVSSQVGCAMNCGFCATGKMGWTRDLSAEEIVGQVLDITRFHRESQPEFKIGNVVFMGMGEPLMNYEAVVRSIRLLNHRDGQNIGIRRFTASTCGLPEQIRRLAKEGLDIVLAVSLHAPNDALRGQIMPAARRWPIQTLLDACRDYIRAVRRRVTFEYALIRGLNDSAGHSLELAALLEGIFCNVNLIPVNESAVHSYTAPDAARTERFRKILEDNGISTVIRERKAADIGGACGQLIIGAARSETGVNPVGGVLGGSRRE